MTPPERGRRRQDHGGAEHGLSLVGRSGRVLPVRGGPAAGTANTRCMTTTTTRDTIATLDDPQLVSRWERLEHGLARSLEQSQSRRAPKPRRRLRRLFRRSR